MIRYFTAKKHFVGFTFLAIAMTFSAVTSTLQAEIPIPGMVCYGQVTIDGEVMKYSDNVAVIARKSGVHTSLVGKYKIGENANAGNNYVLRINAGSLADGSEPSPNAAQLRDNIDLFIKVGPFAEQYAATFKFDEIGGLINIDISGTLGDRVIDLSGDGKVNMVDLAMFAGDWLRTDCSSANQDCNGNDFDTDSDVDLRDLSFLVHYWLDGSGQ